MARLTRMQKYAERRKEMANENEATETTPALDPYKDKLEALVANFNNDKKEEEIKIEPLQTEPKQESEVLNDEPKEENKESDFLKSLDTDNIDKAIEDLFNQKLSILDDEKPTDEEVEADFKVEDEVKDVLEETKEFIPEQETQEPVKEETKEIETPKEEVIDTTPVKEEENINIIDEDYKDIANKLANEVEELDGKVEPVKEEEKTVPVSEPVVIRQAPVKEPEVVNVIDQDYETIAHTLAGIVEELDGKVEPVKEEEKVLPVKETPVVEEVTETPVEESVTEEVVEEIPSKEETMEEIPEVDAIEEATEIDEIPDVSVDDILSEVKEENASDYVDETLKEVEEYNKQDGRKTADDVKDMIVDDIRHNKPEDVDNEEFANTVSLEIDKVLNAINTDAPSIDVADVTLDEVIAPIEEVSTEEVANKLADTIEHPVLAKVSEEEPVEIKSMEETLTSDVVDDTIPFMMDDVKENKEVEYEEIDDEKPNKILNIILIVLIVILLIILGVITYYLLYAKGIIG